MLSYLVLLLRRLRGGEQVGRAVSIAILAAALALIAPASAFAAGLGKLNVLSPLGQALNAEIEIVALRPGEEETLVARVAPLDAFTAAGIEPTAMLNTMRFAIERRGNQRILRMTTTAPVNEPFVELLVELQWSGGRLVREYTFLLDPPEYKSRQAIAAAPKPAAPRPPRLRRKPPSRRRRSKPSRSSPHRGAFRTSDRSGARAIRQHRDARPRRPPPRGRAQRSPHRSPPRRQPQRPAKEAGPGSGAKPAKEEAAKPGALPAQHEVKKGDTLGAIARANLPPGISLNQMLIAIYRANQDAFIRENVNLVRAGRILNIPTAEEVGAIDTAEANKLVRSHMAEFREYRSRLAAVPAPADATPGQREAPAPSSPSLKRRSRRRPTRCVCRRPIRRSPAQRPRRAVMTPPARERALQEAQSRVKDLEKSVADLQKMLEIRNQQLAELEKKAGAKPAPAARPRPRRPPRRLKAPKPAPKRPSRPPKRRSPRRRRHPQHPQHRLLPHRWRKRRKRPSPKRAKPEAPKPKPDAPKPAATDARDTRARQARGETCGAGAGTEPGRRVPRQPGRPRRPGRRGAPAAGLRHTGPGEKKRPRRLDFKTA